LAADAPDRRDDIPSQPRDVLESVEWHRLDLGTTRLGAAVPSPDTSEPWDHFLRVSGAEQATIEMMEDVPQSLSFEHIDTIFEGLRCCGRGS
jgi:hypothetical protein